MEALETEKIRYVVIGMAAAVAQGVLANTLDVDLGIDLPARQYMRVLNLARHLGATIAANTVVYLEDGTPVNLVYEVTGLASFSREGRDKDKLHVLLIDDYLRCQRAARRRCRRATTRGRPSSR